MALQSTTVNFTTKLKKKKKPTTQQTNKKKQINKFNYCCMCVLPLASFILMLHFNLLLYQISTTTKFPLQFFS